MKVLIVYAHPNTEGHCSTILKNVMSELKVREVKFDVLDLYKIKYDPVLHEKELYTARGKTISKINKNIQKKISKSNYLIFIYPIWWGTMPAILKGFFDKILTPKYAYSYENLSKCKCKLPKGLLTKQKAIIFMTSGSPDWLSWIIYNHRANKIIKKNILKFCGIKSKVYRLGNCKHLDDKKKMQISKMVMKGLKPIVK